MENENIKKLYYSISEVSQITSVKKHILRTWEAEFSELHPGKNRAGNRIYRLSDIKTIFLIKRLLYHEKYTIEGAKQKLLVRKNQDKDAKISLEDLRVTDVLSEVRREIQELLALLKEKETDEQKTETTEA